MGEAKRRRLARQALAPFRAGRNVEFSLTFPEGLEGSETLDFSAFVKMRSDVTIGKDGVAVIRFPWPFEDLTLRNGEVLTAEKCAQIREAYRVCIQGIPLAEAEASQESR